MEYIIRDNVPKPEVVKKVKYDFSKIPVGGAMFIRPSEKGETLKKLSDSVKAAVGKFKKETPMNLSVHVREKYDEQGDCIIVRHNEEEA